MVVWSCWPLWQSPGRRRRLQGADRFRPLFVQRGRCTGNSLAGRRGARLQGRAVTALTAVGHTVTPGPHSKRSRRHHPCSAYDEPHAITCLRLLDAAADGADWNEVAQIVPRIDPAREPGRARRAWESHLGPRPWMTEHGYRHLFQSGPSLNCHSRQLPWTCGHPGSGRDRRTATCSMKITAPSPSFRTWRTVVRWRRCKFFGAASRTALPAT
jgi:hypothetical protein